MHPKQNRRALLVGVFVLAAACDKADSTVTVAPEPTLEASLARRTPATEASIAGLQLPVGDSLTLTSKVGTRARIAYWVSNNPLVATVSAKGVVKGVNAGAVRISFISTLGIETTPLTVVNRTATVPAVAMVEINASATSVVVGGQLSLTAVARSAAGEVIQGKSVAWSRLSGTAASLSAEGLLIASSQGVVVVRATIDGVSSDRTFTVTQTPQDAPAPTVRAVVISPGSTVRLAPRATQEFSATALWSNGTSSAASVKWTTTRGTISATGGYTAPSSTGTFEVVATLDGGTLADTTDVVVSASTAPAPTATGFTITPKTSATLAPRATRQFTTSTTWSDGATRTEEVTYAATGGTISSSGLFTAGQVAGAFMVVANCACGRVDTAAVLVTPVVSQLVSLTLSPSNVTLQPNARQQFTPAVAWTTGHTELPPLSYSVSGGTITAQGLYTAPSTPGTYRVIVAHTGGTRRDTSVVTVQASSGVPILSGLQISPASVTVAAGATMQFSTSPLWQGVTGSLPSLAYTATGGTVSSTGLYTAPSAAGTYRVVVAQVGGLIRDTAMVTVTASGGAAAPPPSGNNWSITRNFNSGSVGANAQRTADGFDDAAGASVYTAEQSFEGGRAAKLTVNGGSDGWGQWGGVIEMPTTLSSGRDFWFQLYIFVPASFSISTPGNGSLKFIRVRTKTASGANAGYNDIQLVDDANQSSSFRMIKERQDQWFTFGQANSFTKGVWHRVTVNLKLSNTPSAAGGYAQTRVWQNGKLLTDERRMQTLSSASDVADAIYLFTYWNGNAPKTQSLYVDNIQMASSQPTWASDLEGVNR